jgi:hypothetical protein
VMYSVDRCVRCMRISKSFYGVNFEKIPALLEQSLIFRDEWNSAGVNLDKGEQLQFEIQVGVHTMRRTGTVVEMIYWFLSIIEFQKYFKIDPKVIGYRVTIRRDEFGTKMMKGCLVRPAADDPIYAYRRVRVFNEEVWLLDETLMAPRMRLRAQEPFQTYSAISEKKAKDNKDPSEPCRHDLSIGAVNVDIMFRTLFVTRHICVQDCHAREL